MACSRLQPSPFTVAETDGALAPARDLRARCYVGTALERAGRTASLDYDLNVAADGSVRSVPRQVLPDDPLLVECVRHRLDELRFPARGKDHLNVHFELGPHAATAPRAPREEQLGTCQPACGDGFSCHYEQGSPGGVCRVTPGRCRFSKDCAPSQVCERRFLLCIV